MSNSLRRLSIGLPVYNGEKFIRESIDCILNQTFQDFELIISDNASTDKTEEICREYAAKDNRIRYYRNATNIGCARNFNRAFELSTGEYFKWVAYDDLHAPDFIQKCIEILDQDPTVVLCHAHTSYIDEQGKFIQTYDIKFKTDSSKPQERFQELLTKHYCYQIYGVIRADAIRKSPYIIGCGAADAIFLLRLALLGRFYEIPEYLFFARSHPQQSMSMFLPNYLLANSNNQKELLSELPDFYGYAVWFDTANAGKIIFPHWRILGEVLLSIWKSPLNWQEKLSCLLGMPKRLQGTEYLLLKDLQLAAQTLWKNRQNFYQRLSVLSGG
ncbi:MULTISPECIES: glycosyltransferase family 2 protein [unclassified Tolypothrix]|uniref:glycosyltransferase family 2 protein n=1 Tax=unclassified Tolypothrix TaxID=2649714 RepID=UPI0005EAC0BC|nr:MULTISPECIES: glycosyltransferase family 2 protein [unclassified Tolypothrix]BAY90114.1 glycosyl transferase family protein [Microchaete diplosiphon NIES-3275]EKE97383.1 glycosyltransferase, group 2 family protein [Tolypothrix sp. PCC 7601]MBE9083038.1 glycosyltransferase family 2 protein [Tolypothrix sp. LEGE 11397]UYD24329.1 glycosyltransferase family 2 protein [Tolypothrix sp. PCC 7712]UYD33437.1 glycosyltransferase family 2 protein [Tolypothrix sp. PCC 7601]